MARLAPTAAPSSSAKALDEREVLGAADPTAAGDDDRGFLEADDAGVLADHVEHLGQKTGGR